MQIVHEQSAGLDVHKKTVVACRMRVGHRGKKERETHTFGTTTPALLELSDWLAEWKLEDVAIESTGEYWKPIYNILEGHFNVMLVNAHHVKQVPGRKTDVRDAEWLAELQMYGLLRASYVPSAPQRALRDLTRYRTKLVQERARLLNRLQKVLEDANIKLASVASDVLGMSGRLMLEAILAGERNPERLANLAQGRLRTKIAALVEALTGRIQAHHLFLLEQQLGHFDFLCQQIETISQKILEQIERMDADHSSDFQPANPDEQPPVNGESGQAALTYAQALDLLDTIPGVNRRTAENIIAERGIDMSRFPTAKHAASWSGVAPGNDESAGKRKSGKSTGGNKSLKSALAEAAWAAAHAKQTYLSAQYHRVAGRRGKKRALLAVSHSILGIAYHLLKEQTPYRDLGVNYFDERKQATVVHHLVRRIKKLGFDVELTQVDAVPAG